jgi:AcrR family transcriptional regulator
MARPTVINDDLLLKIAREVFLRRGLRATTAEIAAEAGVSQGILFKRFKSKQALFRAAMNINGDPAQPLPINLDERVGKGKVEDTLKDLGNLLVKKFFGIVPTTMMDWSSREEEEAEENTAESCGGVSGPEKAVKGIQMISQYLAKEVELGRIHCSNTEILAQTFVGALWHYAFLQVTMGEVHKKPITAAQFVDGMVRTLMTGVAPKVKARR